MPILPFHRILIYKYIHLCFSLSVHYVFIIVSLFVIWIECIIILKPPVESIESQNFTVWYHSPVSKLFSCTNLSKKYSFRSPSFFHKWNDISSTSKPIRPANSAKTSTNALVCLNFLGGFPENYRLVYCFDASNQCNNFVLLFPMIIYRC